MSIHYLDLLKQVLTGSSQGKARHAAAGGQLNSHQLSLHPLFKLDEHKKTDKSKKNTSSFQEISNGIKLKGKDQLLVLLEITLEEYFHINITFLS